MPPHAEDASHKVTACPRCAAVRAATIPAMPPPTTRTFFRSLCGTGVIASPSISRPMRGLIAHRRVWVTGRSAMQTKQRRQRSTSLPRLAITLLGSSGSARSARPITTRSASPLEIISSIIWGSDNPPNVATGLFTCFLISLARYTLQPCVRNIDGWVIEKPN